MEYLNLRIKCSFISRLFFGSLSGLLISKNFEDSVSEVSDLDESDEVFEVFKMIEIWFNKCSIFLKS